MAENGGGLLHTFSAIFPHVPQCDEREYIDAVVSGGGVASHFVSGDETSPLGALDRMLDCEDEPFYAPNLYLHWALYDAAKQAGMRILLDGIDGDTTVSHSLLLLADLTRAGHWRQLAAEAAALSRNLRQPAWRLVWNWGVKPLAPAPLRRAWRALRGRDRPISRVNPLIRETFARSETVAPRLEGLLDQRRRARTAREDHWRHLASGLVPFVLEVADRAAAAFGLEPRYPFFDRRAAEFCLALPARQKLRLGWTRFVLRQAMTGLLPAKLQWRSTKTDLTPGFTRGLITSDRVLLQRLQSEPSQSLGRYVDQHILRRASDLALESGTPEAVFKVWPPLTLGLWLSDRGGNRTHVGDPFTKSEEAPAMEPNRIATPDTTASNTEPKSGYATPELTVHGSVETITGNIGTKGTDGLTGSSIG
jgi:asparagine synthase (glutamine-hydrolysing)